MKSNAVKNIRHFPLLVILFLLCAAGCDSDRGETVTGALYNKKIGELKSVSIPSDSIGVHATFRYAIGRNSSMLAGQYEGVSAFSVFKFAKPSQSILDSLVTAKLTLPVNKLWKDGDLEFGLYSTTSAWSDTSRIDADLFIADLGMPIAVVSDTASTVSSLNFYISRDVMASWDEHGSFLLKNTDQGLGMAGLSSDNATTTPRLALITEKAFGLKDTTTVQCREATYYIDNGIAQGSTVISNGDASGFVLYFPLPAFNPVPTAINTCILNLAINEHLLATGSMSFKINFLTNKFTDIASAQINSGLSREVVLTPESTTYQVDISSFINNWYNLNQPNYGILFKPTTICTSPNFAVIEQADSLVIRYTTLPELE